MHTRGWFELTPVLFAGALLAIALYAPASHGQPVYTDGVLHDAELQAVVDAQQQRSGEALAVFLGDESPRIRGRAAYGAGSVRDSSLIPVLLPLLADDTADVRANGAFALGQQPGRVPIDRLLERLDIENDPDVLSALFGALGKKGSRGDFSPLVNASISPELEPDRLLAIAQIGLREGMPSETRDHLIDHLENEDERTQEYAAYYFGRAPSAKLWLDRAETVRNTLIVLGGEQPASAHLIRGLSRLADEDDLPLFTRFLAPPADWRAQVEAVRAIRQLADSEHVPLGNLLSMLYDENGLVQLESAETLAAAAPWPADIHHEVRDLVLEGRLQWPAESFLLGGLAAGNDEEMLWNRIEQWDGHPNALAATLPALEHVQETEAVGYLTAAVRSDEVPVAASALEQLATPHYRDHLDDDTIQAVLRNVDRHLVAVQPIVAYALTTFMSAADLSDETIHSLLDELYRNLENDHVGVRVHLINYAAGSDLDVVPGFAQEALTQGHSLVQEAAADLIEGTTGTRPLYDPAEAEHRAEIDWAFLRAVDEQGALRFETDRGPFTVRLLPEEAPLTVQTVVELAEGGSYDGVPFHRVIANFVAQGGDVAGDYGFGGPGFNIRSEFTRLRYETGTAGMASSGYDTEGSQFFFTHSMQPHLNGNYTAFGYVIEGQDVVDSILPFDEITRVRLVEAE